MGTGNTDGVEGGRNILAAFPVRRNPSALILWAASAAGTALLVRNPWYLMVLAAAGLFVRWRTTGERPSRTTLGLLASMLIMPALLNLLFSRAGNTVILQLPWGWLGGPYTLEALLFGATAGMQIATLVAIMVTFGTSVLPSDLLRRTPAALYPAGVAATIGLSFVSQVQRSFGVLREAQQVRGYNPRGMRDLPKVATPLVILSLENALALAEGLVARGFGGRGLRVSGRAWTTSGLLSLASGLVLWALMPNQAMLAAGLAAFGLLALWRANRMEGRIQRYRPEPWRRSDTMATGLNLGAFAVFLLIALVHPAWITFHPYPQATWPSFIWPIGLAAGILSAPGWFEPHD